MMKMGCLYTNLCVSVHTCMCLYPVIVNLLHNCSYLIIFLQKLYSDIQRDIAHLFLITGGCAASAKMMLKILAMLYLHVVALNNF